MRGLLISHDLVRGLLKIHLTKKRLNTNSVMSDAVIVITLIVIFGVISLLLVCSCVCGNNARDEF